jgi:hypothetical protein
LDYNNSTRRAKILCKKGWIRKAGKRYIPLIVWPPLKPEPKTDENTVNFTVPNDSKTVKFTVDETEKTVNITDFDCNIYSKQDENAVNFTVFDETYKECINSLNTENFETTTTTTTSETNGHKSQFPIEEIIRYIDIRIANGERIETPHKLARWMHQTGEFDVFIQATLYPEPIEQQTIEYDDGEAPTGEAIFTEPQPLDFYGRIDAVEFLRERARLGENLGDYQKLFVAEDWTLVMEELRK